MSLKKLFFLVARVLLFQMILPYGVYGQEIKSSHTTELKNITLQQLTDTIKLSNPNQRKIFKEILLNYEEEDFAKASALLEIGNFFYKKKAYKESVAYADEAIKLFGASLEHQKSVYRCYMIKGNGGLLSWKYTDALNAYYKGLEINQKYIKDDIKEAIVNINIAIVYRKVKQFTQAKKVYKNTLKFIENSEIANSIEHVKILSEVSFLYIDLKEYDSVVRYVNDGIRISDLYNYPAEKANFYTANGIVLYNKKQYKDAIRYFSDAENIFLQEEFPEKRYIVNNSYYKAKCFYDQGLYKKSIHTLDKVIGFINHDEFNTEAVDVYNLLATSNKVINNEKQAIYWYEKSIELGNKSKENESYTVDAIYKKEKQELGNTISILEKAKSNSAIGLLFLATLTGFILFLYLKKQKSNKLVFNELLEKVNHLETQKDKKEKCADTGKKVIIDNQKIDKVLRELEKLERHEYFLNIDCNLSSMSKKIKTNTLYLSKIIKNYKEKSFNEYVNDLRIDYVLKRLKNDKKFRLFSIKSIASEIGYKSDHSFVKHFKAKTGLNPSYYIKNIKQLNSNS